MGFCYEQLIGSGLALQSINRQLNLSTYIHQLATYSHVAVPVMFLCHVLFPQALDIHLKVIYMSTVV